MQKAVFKLAVGDEKDKKKAMKIVSGFAGVNSIEISLKDQKLTVTGDTDPVKLVGKLRKTFNTTIITVGPAKEAQKKDDNKKDDENKKKDDNKSNKDSKADQAKVFPIPPVYYPPPYYYARNMSVEEDPTGCVIS